MEQNVSHQMNSESGLSTSGAQNSPLYRVYHEVTLAFTPGARGGQCFDWKTHSLSFLLPQFLTVWSRTKPFGIYLLRGAR